MNHDRSLTISRTLTHTRFEQVRDLKPIIVRNTRLDVRRVDMEGRQEVQIEISVEQRKKNMRYLGDSFILTFEQAQVLVDAILGTSA